MTLPLTGTAIVIGTKYIQNNNCEIDIVLSIWVLITSTTLYANDNNKTQYQSTDYDDPVKT